MVDSTEAPGGRGRPCSGSAGGPILNSVNLEEGDDAGHPARHVPDAGPRVRRGRGLHLHRRGGPGPHGRVEAAGGHAPSTTSPSSATGSRPQDLLFDPLVLPLSTGMEESRRDGIETIEGIRRIKAELPGVYTIVGLSNVSFGLNPAARQVLNSVFLHECVEAGLDAAIVHALEDPARCPRSTSGPARSASTSSTTAARDGYDPLPGAARPLRGRLGRRRRHRGPHATGRSSAASSSASSTATATASRTTSTRRSAAGHGAARHRQRLPAGRHEDGRRAVRLRRDAAALRAAVGRDHEGGRRLPRAAHGEGRPGRQGHHRPGHGQGRRARHRQEPGRHHPHQQRLRGGQPRHQGRHQRDGRGRRGAQGRRHRHERPAGQVHPDHAREPRGAEPTRPLAHPGHPGRRRPDPHLRRAGPARGLRRPALLRQGRLRGPAHHGPARRADARPARTTPSSAREIGGRNLPPRKRELRTQAAAEARRAASPADASPTWPPTTRSSCRPSSGSRVAKGIAIDDIAAYLNETALFRNQWGFRPGERRERPDVQGPGPGRAARAAGQGQEAEQLLVPQVA